MAAGRVRARSAVPGFLDAAGLTASAWARGPFHQWGPIQKNFGEAKDDARVMQFPSEFEWISPSGRGVLTHYMPHHYSAGWWMDASADLDAAMTAVFELYRKLKPVASTRNVLLPVGTDYTPPNRWVTQIHRAWAEKYLWPRFVCALPREFFSAVRRELAEKGRRPSPQSRDMNPVYTGKDVSFIDTKQAQQACEVAVLDAEKLATLASLQGLGRYPAAAIDKTWRQIAYGAHHDAITGSESDQVYLDLLTGWREAHDLASGARDASLAALVGRIDLGGAGPSVVVFNTLSFDRSDLVRLPLPDALDASVGVADEAGTPVPCAVDDGILYFHAHDVPALGWRTWQLVEAAPTPLWHAADGFSIENARYRVTADPRRGGGLASVYDLRYERELIGAGDIGNELRVYEEYPQHPDFGEGPWHLVPKGLHARAADAAADVRRETGPLGERLIVTGTIDGTTYEQTVTLWLELDRVECRTRLLDFSGADRLFRVRFPADLPGALPVCEVADAVIGRGFAFPESDVAEQPWTLDNPANSWFGLGSTARVVLHDAEGSPVGERALGIAEVIVPTLDDAGDARELVVALARVGVTATTSAADWARYGWLEVDSNLPDFRIVLGGPQQNPAARELLKSVGEDEGRSAKFAAALDKHGRVWIPARTPLRAAWQPNADLRDLRSLPALIVAAHELGDLVADVADARIEAVSVDGMEPDEGLTDHTVALLTKGLPSFAADASGALYLSLMRSCTGWPSGGWVDPPKRTLPDGSGFQLQHWTHEFEYALVSGKGDWRALTLPAQGQEYNHPLYARTADPGQPPGQQPEPRHGQLPPTWSWLRITPQRHALLGALKPTGDPIAHGSARPQDPATGVTLRLVEASGLGQDAVLRGTLRLDGLRKADLLEEHPIGRTREDRSIRLVGAEVATVTAIPGLVMSASNGSAALNGAALGSEAEIAQPIFARYWLHNRGPAPMGYLPVSIGVSPTMVRTDATPTPESAEPAHTQPFELSIALTSQLVDAEAKGIAELILPEGWHASELSHVYRLAPCGHKRFSVVITPPNTAAPGIYFIPVRTTYCGQQIEDIATVALGLGLDDDTVPRPDDGLTVTASLQESRIELVLVNTARSEIHGEIQIAAPYDAWDAIPSPARGFSVEADAEVRIGFDIAAGPATRPGTYWAVAKVMYFGRCQYAPALPVVIKH